ncbi:MAG TPA: hypothetical protein VFB32_04065 [Rudaea sp.]|nr:hypothetical protein [Rudaea sp.]
MTPATSPGTTALRGEPARPEREAAVASDRNEALAVQLLALERETAYRTQLEQELEDLRQENARLRLVAEQLQADMIALNRALEIAAAPPPDVPAPAADPLAPSVDWSAAPDDVLRLRVHAQNLTDQIKAIHASLSWRITRPLRALVGALRKGKR